MVQKGECDPPLNTRTWKEDCWGFLGKVAFLLPTEKEDLPLSSGPCHPRYDIKSTLKMAEETDGEKLGPWWFNWAPKSSNPPVYPHFGPVDFLLCKIIHFHIVEASLNQGFWAHCWNQCERELSSISPVCQMELWPFASLCSSLAYSIVMIFSLHHCGDFNIHPEIGRNVVHCRPLEAPDGRCWRDHMWDWSGCCMCHPINF